MSLTSTVPAAVPSLFHNSVPCGPSLAEKNSDPFTSVMLPGESANELSMTVPAAVPSLFHSFHPFALSYAEKNSVLFTSVRYLGLEEVFEALVLMSLTIDVPAAVPSLFHNS